MAIGVALLLLLILFLVSHMQSRLLSSVMMSHVRNTEIVIRVLAFLFFPGVLIHELAHFLMASLLFVPTGEIEFVPVIHGNTVKLGSVAIAKTDLLRRFLIGVAPLLFGLAIMMGIYWFLSPVDISLNWKMLVLLITLFEIGNTMFSSKKDLEGALGVVILTILLLVAGLVFRLPLLVWGSILSSSSFLADVFWRISGLLGIVVGLDILLVLFLLALKKYIRPR